MAVVLLLIGRRLTDHQPVFRFEEVPWVLSPQGTNRIAVVEPTPYCLVGFQKRGGTIMGKGYIIEGPMF